MQNANVDRTVRTCKMILVEIFDIQSYVLFAEVEQIDQMTPAVLPTQGLCGRLGMSQIVEAVAYEKDRACNMTPTSASRSLLHDTSQDWP